MFAIINSALKWLRGRPRITDQRRPPEYDSGTGALSSSRSLLTRSLFRLAASVFFSLAFSALNWGDWAAGPSAMLTKGSLL